MPHHLSPITDHRPWVSLNMAMSFDGKVATANRRISSFGSATDHAHLYELRAQADAVICGATTVNDENADLGSGGSRYEKLRLRKGLSQHNLRVVVSGSAKLSTGARIFSEAGGPIILLVGSLASRSKCKSLEQRGAIVHRSKSPQVNLKNALHWLQEKWNVRRLHCEGGGTLNDAFFREDLIDEIHLTICPVLIGGRLAPTISDGSGFTHLREMRRFTFQKVRRVGNEFFCVLKKSAAAQGRKKTR